MIGTTEYNQNEIPSMILSPGSYVLDIFEPFDTEDLTTYELASCVTFTLIVNVHTTIY